MENHSNLKWLFEIGGNWFGFDKNRFILHAIQLISIRLSVN